MMIVYKIKKYFKWTIACFAVRVSVRKKNNPKVFWDNDYILHSPKLNGIMLSRRVPMNSLACNQRRATLIEIKKHILVEEYFVKKVDVLEIIRNKQFYRSYSILERADFLFESSEISLFTMEYHKIDEARKLSVSSSSVKWGRKRKKVPRSALWCEISMSTWSFWDFILV